MDTPNLLNSQEEISVIDDEILMSAHSDYKEFIFTLLNSLFPNISFWSFDCGIISGRCQEYCDHFDSRKLKCCIYNILIHNDSDCKICLLTQDCDCNTVQDIFERYTKLVEIGDVYGNSTKKSK